MKRSLLCTALGLVLAASIPGAALAAPMDYDISAGGTISVGGGGGFGGRIRLGAGTATYDAATGMLYGLTFNGYSSPLMNNGPIQLTPPPAGMASSATTLLPGGGVSLSARAGQFTIVRFDLSPQSGPGGVGTAVPEPTAAMLFGAGILCAGYVTRRRQED